jgi:hypothetical protein
VRQILLASISLAAACGGSGSEPRAAPGSSSAAPAAKPADQGFPDEQAYLVERQHKTQTFYAPRAEVLDTGKAPRATLRYATNNPVELELKDPDGSWKFFGAPAPLDDGDHVVMMRFTAMSDPKDGRASVMLTDRGQVLDAAGVHGVGELLYDVVAGAVVVLPDPEVGPGARWRIREPVLDGGIGLAEVTYTLVSLDGDRAMIDADGRILWIDDNPVDAPTGRAHYDAARAAVARLHGRAFEDLPHLPGRSAHTVEHAVLDLRAPLAGTITIKQTATTDGNAKNTLVELDGEYAPPPDD